MKEKPLTEFMSRAKEKRKKPAPKASGLKGPWELPEGWKWVRLGDILTFQYGISKKLNEDSHGYPILRMNNITYDGKLDLSELKFVELDKNEFKKYRLEKGDILINRTNSKELVGKTTVFNVDGDYVFASYIIRGRLKIENVIPEFIAMFLNSPYIKAQFLEMARQAVQMANINAQELSRILIPLPPLSEQKRIVAKLDEVSRRLEEAKRLAREAREEAEKLMASALHEVFSKVEERGWEWVRLGDVAKDMKPGFARNKKHISEDGIPHLRPNNIDIGHLNLEKVVKVKLDDKINIEEYYLRKGDVLFNNTNSYELVGRAAIVPENLPWGYSNHITRIRVKEDVILPEWLTVAINYLWMQGYFRNVCTRWVGQAGVNMNTLKETPIPLPPLEEQKRLVTYLNRISEHAQRLVKLYEERERELERLFPAILDRAFRGEI